MTVRLNNLVYPFVLLLSAIGCDNHSSKTSRPVDQGPFNPGQAVYQSVEGYVAKADKGPERVLALRSSCTVCRETEITEGTHKAKIIDSVNTLFRGKDVTSPTPTTQRGQDNSGTKLLKTLYDLIDDNTLPQLTDSLGLLLKEISGDATTVQALKGYVNAPTGCNLRNVVDLIRKVLEYPKAAEATRAFARIVEQNPEILRSSLRTLSEALTTLPETGPEVGLIGMLFELLSKEIPLEGESVLGQPAWLARLDTNNNPKVIGWGEEMVKPFVDKVDLEGKPFPDGICDVNSEGRPVDENGNPLNILAFGKRTYKDGQGNTLIYRDELGRAVSPKGDFVFEYSNAKKTIVGVLVFSIGNAIQRNIHKDSFMFSRVALLPKKVYSDSLGLYEGYADDGDYLKATLGALELLKQEMTRDLLRGFAKLIQKKLVTARKFFGGFGRMILKLRDEDLANEMMMWFRMVEMMKSGEIPELKEAIGEMEEIEVELPGNTTIKLNFLFSNWLAKHHEEFIINSLWPLRKALRNVKQAYAATDPPDPLLTERLLKNVLEWALGSLASQEEQEERTLAPILPVVLRLLVVALSEQTDAKVDAIKKAFQETVTSRAFASTMQCQETFIHSPEAKVLDEALVYYVTPQPTMEREVYGEVVRVAVALLECRKDIEVRIRLLKTIGKLIDPDRPVITKLLEVMGRILKVDNSLVLMQTMRLLCTKCCKYDLPPILMFGHATVDVLRVGDLCQHPGEISEGDVRRFLMDLSEMMLDHDELVQLLYRVIRNRSRG